MTNTIKSLHKLQSQTPPATFLKGSKQALLASLLSRENGASITELTDAMGWQPHTTRAAVTGLRKRGCAITTSKRDGVFRYHMVGVATDG